jgi:hypothetical protein
MENEGDRMNVLIELTRYCRDVRGMNIKSQDDESDAGSEVDWDIGSENTVQTMSSARTARSGLSQSSSARAHQSSGTPPLKVPRRTGAGTAASSSSAQSSAGSSQSSGSPAVVAVRPAMSAVSHQGNALTAQAPKGENRTQQIEGEQAEGTAAAKRASSKSPGGSPRSSKAREV